MRPYSGLLLSKEKKNLLRTYCPPGFVDRGEYGSVIEELW